MSGLGGWRPGWTPSESPVRAQWGLATACVLAAPSAAELAYCVGSSGAANARATSRLRTASARMKGQNCILSVELVAE